MPISSETEDAIRSVCDSVLCPLCGKFNDHNKYESLMSCGHHLCSNCVRSFVLKSDNKCPKCYQLNNKNDIKTDQFMTDLRKMTSKLGQLIDKNTNKKNQLKTIESESKQLPKSESKCAPKTQKGLIIESLKACISSCSKTKEKKSSEELSRIENSSKKSLKLLPQTKAQIMVQLSGDLDPNKESVPDSYDSNLRFTQDSHNLNKDNDLMGKVSQIVDDLQSNSSNSQIKTNKSDSNEKEYTDLAINKNTTEGKSNAGFEQNCESNDLKKYETNIAKKTHLGNKQKQNVLKSSAVVKSNELNDKKKERQETNEKSIQVELMTFKPKLSKEKLIQVSIEEEKPETDDKEIQVMIKSSDFSVQHKTQTIDVYSQTTESQVFSDGQQTNSCNANNCCLHKNLSKIIELNLCPTLNALLNGLLTHSNDVNNHNQTRAVFANSVQENESIVTKNAVSSEKIANNFEKLTETNDSINESYELSSKSVPIKPSKRQSNKQNNTKNAAKRSAVQMKAKSKKIKTEETVAKPSVSDDSTSHLDLKDNKESNTELIEDKMPETTLNHKSNRTNAGKKMSQKTHVKTSSTSSEDEEDLHLISEKNSFEKTRNTRKLTPNQKKRKLIDCNTDKMDSDDQMQTKTNPRKQRKPVKRLPPKVKEIKNIDEEEDKICNNSKKNVSSLKRSSRTVSNIPNEDKFKRPTSPTPSISSIASSSSTSSRLRTSSTERPQMKRFCILNSGLDDSHKKKIINVGKELNAEVVSDWSDRVTHLVIGLVKDRNKKERICQRNIKFMKALMANKWIVSFDWITDSLRSNRFVDESNYEIKGVKNAVESNAPNKSRTSGLKLFKDRMVCFKGKFSRLACDIEEIKQLVTIGGGLLIDSEKEFKPINGNIKLISVSEAIGLPNTQNGIKYMSVNTFLDMISNFEDF